MTVRTLQATKPSKRDCTRTSTHGNLPPALMAKFRSEVDSLPLSWSTRGRRNTFASYHCCTLIHKRAQYLAFLSSALLALINRPPLRLTLAGEASDDQIGSASCRERVCQDV